MTNDKAPMTKELHSFPGSAWERTAPEALPPRAGGACKTVRYEAEPRNERTRRSPVTRRLIIAFVIQILAFFRHYYSLSLSILEKKL